MAHNALTHADLGGPEVIIPLEPASLTGGNTIHRAVGKQPQHLRKHCVCFVWGFFYAFFFCFLLFLTGFVLLLFFVFLLLLFFYFFLFTF